MDKHHHHHMIDNSSVDSTTSIPPTIASTLIQTLLTTVMTHTINQKMHVNDAPSSPGSHFHVSPTESAMDVLDHSGHIAGQHMPSMPANHMIMYFHSGVDAIILFKEWSISSTEGMVGSVIGIFLMAMLYEAIKFFREYMFKKYFTSLEYSSVSVLADDGRTVTEVHKVARNRMCSWPHIVQTVLHIVQMVLSYFLMLIFMTYNVWLCLGVVLGAGTGYFLFGWRKATVVDITEHCH